MNGEVLLIAITALGSWWFSFYLNKLTLRRNEVSRTKDNLVKKIEKLERDLIKNGGKDNFDAESFLGSRCTQIEFYINQLNFRAGPRSFSCTNLPKIRSLHVSQEMLKQGNSEEISDFLEKIELDYQRYLEKNLWRQMNDDFCEYRHVLFGAITGAAIILAYSFLVFIILQD